MAATANRILDQTRYTTLGNNLCADTPALRYALEAVREHLGQHPDADETACPCGASDDAELVRCDRNGLPFPLALCQACGLMRGDPQPRERAGG